MAPYSIFYVTSSGFKVAENKIFSENAHLSDGTQISDVVAFEIVNVPITEILSEKLRVMVMDEVTKAYQKLRVPCIVEHAGLIFEDYKDSSYPGGLTKPMWDTLREKFIAETASKGRRAIAQAVVAYCDGMRIHTFEGETAGSLAPEPRGSRAFYWDTIFIPDDPSGAASGKTYAEIADDPALGLAYKVLKLSQSSKAMMKFVEYLKTNSESPLWSMSSARC